MPSRASCSHSLALQSLKHHILEASTLLAGCSKHFRCEGRKSRFRGYYLAQENEDEGTSRTLTQPGNKGKAHFTANSCLIEKLRLVACQLFHLVCRVIQRERERWHKDLRVERDWSSKCVIYLGGVINQTNQIVRP